MQRSSMLAQWRRLPHPLRWVGVALVGSMLIGVGVVLLVLPGPGLLLIALGVAVLATEFAWAESILARMKKTGSAAADGARRALARRRGESPRGESARVEDPAHVELPAGAPVELPASGDGRP